MNNNNPPLTFKRFQTIVSRLELPRRPLASVSQQQMNQCLGKISDNHDQLYSIPSLEELGKHLQIHPQAVLIHIKSKQIIAALYFIYINKYAKFSYCYKCYDVKVAIKRKGSNCEPCGTPKENLRQQFLQEINYEPI